MVSAMFCTVGIVVKAPMINTNRNFEISTKDGSTYCFNIDKQTTKQPNNEGLTKMQI